MSFWDRMFGRGSREASARKAEARGELAQASALWAEAGRVDEAARVMLLRGDADSDLRQKLAFYVQAAALAPLGTEANRAARLKRAALVVAMAEGGRDGRAHAAVSGAVRLGLLEVARDLEALGELTKSAEAFAAAGDVEGEARALALAGDVDRLEDLLSSQQANDRETRSRQSLSGDLELLVSTGRRRDALGAATAFLKAHPSDASMRDRLRGLQGRRIEGPVVRGVFGGQTLTLVLGDEVTIGRTEGSLRIASTAVSRKHLSVSRAAGGTNAAVVMRDLASRNGVQLHGMDMTGDIPLGDGVDLRLGREVPIKVSPSRVLAGAVDIEVGGARYVAPLGVARLDALVGSPWRLELGSDGWVELVTNDDAPPLEASVTLVPRVTLLAGDALSATRGGAVVLRMLGSDAP